MSRHLRLAGGVTALVVTAAVLPVVALSTPAVAAPAPAAAVAGAPAVALLVKYPSGTVRTWCVTYRAGMSGADVLAPAKPTYGSGPYAGFVLKIGNTGTVPPTASNYWAYWRSTNGKGTGYAYSGSGVTSTRPTAGSVEAWVWNAGSETAFPKRGYSFICPNGATTSS